MVKWKQLPLPNSLSTQIVPPCFCTKSLQISKPKPVPFSPAVPKVLFFVVTELKSDVHLAADMPMPLSITCRWMSASSIAQFKVICPLFGVNLMALLIKLRNTVLIMFLSIFTNKSWQILFSMRIFFWVAGAWNRRVDLVANSYKDCGVGWILISFFLQLGPQQ